MSDLMRMTGLYSGLDTDAVIQSLVSTKAQKVTNLKNEQKKLEWKQNIWQDLNSRIYNLYSKTLSNMRLTGTYAKKTTKVSDPSKATILAGDNAVNGQQTLQINKLAKAGYLTGAKIAREDIDSDITGTTTLRNIDSNLVGTTISITVGKGNDAKTTDIEITGSTTVQDFVNKLNEAGVKASFDEKNQRFFISASATGEANGFTLSADSADALKSLGLDSSATYENGSECTEVEAQDAEIILNGAKFTSDTNSFNINGLTINATGVTDGEITISTDTDYDGIYDMIKDFISEYNEIINDIYSKYNADSARKYTMLSDDDKEAMSDDEVEKWEDTIKNSLLRKDNDLYNVMSAMTGITSTAYNVNGKTMYLADFGIGTLNYFEAEENARKALSIDGDEDYTNSDKTNKLKAAIANDPEGTIEFFAALCKDLYDNIDKTMQRTEYRSIYKVYDDKRLQSEYDDYTKKIAAAEKALNAYEDRWYDKFSAMEVALSKLQSNQNMLSSMLGF